MNWFNVCNSLWTMTMQDVKRERKSKTGDRNKNQTTIYTLRKRKNKNLFSFDLHNLINRYTYINGCFQSNEIIKNFDIDQLYMHMWFRKREIYNEKQKKLSIEIENYA